VGDRTPVPKLLKALSGKVFGDKGYISEALTASLLPTGVELITKVRKDMKPQMLSSLDKMLLRKRAIIENVIDQMKNISQMEHTTPGGHRLLVEPCRLIDCLLPPAKEAIP